MKNWFERRLFETATREKVPNATLGATLQSPKVIRRPAPGDGPPYECAT